MHVIFDLVAQRPQDKVLRSRVQAPPRSAFRCFHRILCSLCVCSVFACIFLYRVRFCVRDDFQHVLLYMHQHCPESLGHMHQLINGVGFTTRACLRACSTPYKAMSESPHSQPAHMHRGSCIRSVNSQAPTEITSVHTWVHCISCRHAHECTYTSVPVFVYAFSGPPHPQPAHMHRGSCIRT